MNRISAVLITKNESKVIARCLKSLQGLDQVIVHDTGSTDDTVEIARSMGADVSETTIAPFHFAQARNQAMMRAKNRWILSIDADEVLREGSMGPLFEAAKNFTLAAYQVGYENRAVEGGSTMFNPRVVFFQKGRWIWKYRVHERLAPLFPPAKVGRLLECMIEHHPDPDKSVRRAQNIELLKMCVEENPEYFYASRQLGLEYVLLEKWADAIPNLEVHVRQPVDPADAPYERVASRMQLGKCLARVGNLDRAMEEFDTASQEAPLRREPLYWAAIECIAAAQPWNAIPWLERCIKVPPDDMPEFSLYGKEIQRDLPATTLMDCQTMIDEAKARYEAQRGKAG
jgi:glycosyltransferase involved in cell wall biosynthesis